jgi:hypothetical protein
MCFKCDGVTCAKWLSFPEHNVGSGFPSSGGFHCLRSFFLLSCAVGKAQSLTCEGNFGGGVSRRAPSSK